ncbi:MAG TPA: Xaa-Pro peptidase family protein [Steroidobacteraceae bacterium]|nr:Xaa-Pro peptidase family protein [Steroidobacteraceae bacterium]
MMTAGAALAAGAGVHSANSPEAGLRSLTKNAKPISADEHVARLAKLQSLMRERKVGAFLVESGTSLEYFTGIRWRRSERITAAVVPATGGIIVVTPFFEEPSIRELLRVSAEVRPWQEDENPFDLIASALRERAPEGPLAVEETTRFFIIDRMRKSFGAGRDVVSGEDLVRACRMIKSPAELALLQVANNVTLAAIRHVHGQVEAGMQWPDILRLQVAATEALGGTHEFTLVLLNEASAFPHGSEKPQVVGKGSVILIDTGCSVHGYLSDISRTWVFGEPSARQREVWNTVKRGQEIAQETAKIGVPVGAIDKAVRAYYEGRGWSKNYRLPGTPHRTGHGIGMDVHEPPYLVRNDTTPLAAGMCFSDEPGIYIPGEFGVRMEDCWYMTEAGPKFFTPLAASIDRPV